MAQLVAERSQVLKYGPEGPSDNSVPRYTSHFVLRTPFVGSRLVWGSIYELTLVQNMILKGGPKSSASSHFSSIFDLFFRSKKGYTIISISGSEGGTPKRVKKGSPGGQGGTPSMANARRPKGFLGTYPFGPIWGDPDQIWAQT